MFSLLRNRFGIPGVISVIALVFAMFGGAYAATSSGGGGKATASAKGKPGPRGPRGKTGPVGPAGPAGPQGPAGAKGDKGDAGAKGDKGDKGDTGSNGAPGTSVASEEFAGSKEGHCTEGGSKFTVGASKTFACNGKEGPEGEAGILHPGETLPSEATETGMWRFESNGNEEQYYPISFPIPLSATDAESTTVHFKPDANFSTFCPGTINKPAADPGALCFYEAKTNLEQPTLVVSADGFTEKVGTSGVLLFYETVNSTLHQGGSFAVTAP